MTKVAREEKIIEKPGNHCRKRTRKRHEKKVNQGIERKREKKYEYPRGRACIRNRREIKEE